MHSCPLLQSEQKHRHVTRFSKTGTTSILFQKFQLSWYRESITTESTVPARPCPYPSEKDRRLQTMASLLYEVSHWKILSKMSNFLLKNACNRQQMYMDRAYMSKWSSLFKFVTKISYTVLISPMHATCNAHLLLLNLITLITSSKK
jgi:hypothetical protein